MTDVNIGATPKLQLIGSTVGDTAPHSMSEMYGVRFSSGNSPTSGTISLSDFRNKTISPIWDEQVKLQPSDVDDYYETGISVSMTPDGNTAIVGARGVPVGTSSSVGAAYIFTRSGTTWSQQAKLQALDGGWNNYLGEAVSISSDGNTAIAGARGVYNVKSDAGAAYIFTRSGTTWSQQAKLVASDPGKYDYLGITVSISSDGNTAIAGASHPTGGTSDTSTAEGAVYVFTRSGSTWSQQAKLQSSDGEYGDEFACSVSISSDGNTVIAGARFEDTGATLAGAAYIFTRSGSTWSQQAKIQASDRAANDYFGTSVSISSDGNTAIIGAEGEDPDNIAQAGAAYIFTRSGTTWSQQAKLVASDKEGSDDFGTSVFISSDGNTAIIGAKDESTGATLAGAAYIFTRSGSTWTEKQKVQASDKQAYDQFGAAVSISGNGRTAIVGARLEDTNGSGAGAAYIFNQLYFV